MKARCVLIAALLLLWIPVAADTIDDDPEAVSLYARGKRLMREGDFLEASRVFEELSGRFAASPNIDLFVYNRAKADYYFGDYASARAAFSNFVSRFPRSTANAHARFFLGNIDHIRGNLDLAVQHYIDAYAHSVDPRLTDLALASLNATIATATTVRLSPADFSAIPRDRRCEVMVPVAEALLAREQFASGQRLLAECNVDLSGEAVPDGSLTSSFEVAMVLPFSGELQSFGEAIYNGAVVAAEQYRSTSGLPLSLRSYDTKGDPIDAARIVRELAGGTTDLIVGPLTSDEAAVASAALSCDYLPMIAPAATQAGLTRLSETAFQMSPNVELQGIQMAEYAVNNKAADSAVILTSTNNDHLRMARAFADRFEELGGTVVALEYYRSRDTDFGPYLRDIKAILLGEHPDSAFFIDANGDTLDFDVVPAAVDCFFLPGTASQLRLLVPQLHFYNLSGQMLGSDGWGDNAVYRLGDRITKRAVFPSPFLEGEQSEAFVRFSAAYDARYGERPARLARLGYDAIQLVTTAIQQGAVTRERLVEELSRTTGYQGASGTITFGDSRENVAMPLYRIEGEQPVYLGVGETISDTTAVGEL